ncbi:MAG: DUF2281 domain-containing protein [Anaerolineae bacterium CFX3]|nr:DUF2281 domain-containing protein [Anaerolineales bacterium]MCC7512842.1 DUF2281 domain-containing protein [Anaerolineae bacterium]MCE7905116.1 DUF2281 domain-containing protein [Anaerolineae bacterium CFX3]OQY86662.1 MAG: prevent-host-death protein [Anaerolineae bacterium UTCFX3]MCQ3946425.1 prevent-host-death protein [Anaerolineae bacterium]
MRQVNFDDAKVRLMDWIEAALRGDKIIIVKDGKQMAELIPIKRAGKRKFGGAKGKIKIKEDFDAPLDDFREYMQ